MIRNCKNKTNFKRHIKNLTNTKNKKIILGLITLLVTIVLLSFTFSANIAYEEVKSVEISSDGWSDVKDDRTGGSWNITKSAEWTGDKKAQIKFDLETTGMLEDGSVPLVDGIDAIFVLDNSASMRGDRISQLRDDANALVEELLNNSNNRAALIKFNTTATLLSDFTNDKILFKKYIDDVTTTGDTNYERAFLQVDNLLSHYTRDERRILVMIFLTDGYPTSKNHRAQYPYLKQKYPYMIINAIQYELGHSILEELIAMSDYQYLANRNNLYDALFMAYSSAIEGAMPNYMEYNKFIVTDYISEDFYVERKEDVKVSIGTVDLVNVDGKQKVIWYLTDDTFKTGSKATMSIDATYIGNPSEKKYVPTNEKEEITYKLPNEEEKEKVSEKTPVLQAQFNVIYEGNLPDGCTLLKGILPETESYAPFSVVTKSNQTIECDGYHFKGWNFANDTGKEILKVNDSQFVMPTKDVVIRAEWSKVTISKNMDGKIYEGSSLYATIKNNAKAGVNGTLTLASSIDKDFPIYYYGTDTYNHVLFANLCWRIVRTTETGGIKIVYDGAKNSKGVCANTGGSALGKKNFNSSGDYLSHVGYMYNSRLSLAATTSSSYTAYIYGNSAIYDGTTYTLQNTGDLSVDKHYTCLSTTKTTCTTLYYMRGHNYVSSSKQHSYWRVKLTSGQMIEDFLELSLGANDESIDKNGVNKKGSANYINTKNSAAKSSLDTWYKNNISAKGFSSYLEDTVWCNNREIYLLGGFDPNSGAISGSGSYITSNESLVFSSKIKDTDLACPRKIDSFTVSPSNGNGDLTYPIGLITYQEALLAKNAIKTSIAEYTMSPAWSGYYPHLWYTNNTSISDKAPDNSEMYIRPSVSLKKGIRFSGGDGTASSPYIISDN